MADKTIPQLTYGGGAPDPLSLVPIAPLTSGSSDTDPSLNTYGDAKCVFVKDLLGVDPYVVSFTIPGAPLANDQATYVLFRHAVTFPANFGAIASGQSSGATGTANATGSTVFSIDKRTASPNTWGTNVGTITIAASGVVETLATAGGTAYTTAPGEVWRIKGPSSADATFANLIATLVGTR